ncbi:uncharacterized protein [Typha angustifolia]|uniref:uncharacterized protein n=1 Tax=Typha angustifolia TaxID=59011 RepID=UPI003C2BA200
MAMDSLSCLVSERMRRRFDAITAKKMVIGLVLGQLASLLITSTSFSSSELARQDFNAPTSQSLINYVLLAVVYGAVMINRSRWLKSSWYYYLVLGIVDVEANYLVVKAYQYASLTSIMLLDCWVIPCVIVLTWLFLKRKYTLMELIGAAICVGAAVLVVFSDAYASDREAGGPDPVKGDMFVLAGSTLYAVSNVGEEYLVKKGDRIEVMAMLGSFGAVISALQISILERNELRTTKWTAGAVLPFLGFALAMFIFYSTVPTILKICGATMLNLSLLSSDMWGVLIRIFAYHQKVDWMYFIAFAGVLIGLVIYSKGSKEEGQTQTAQVAEANDEQVEQDKGMDEEVAIGHPVQGSSLEVTGQSSGHVI